MKGDEGDVCIGLDLGTSGIRAVAIDCRGEELTALAMPLPPPNRDRPQCSLQNPDDWWRASVALLQQLTARLKGCTVRVVTVDGTSATLLLIREDGTPVTPALMYDDTQASDFVPLIRVRAPAASAVHSASSSLAKLLYLLRQRPAALSLRASHQADWIQGKLTGRFGISDENNCLKLGYDAMNRCWPDWMEGFSVPSAVLPEVYPAGTPIGLVSATASRVTGLPITCVVTTGTTDSVAAAIASGLSRPGDAVTSLGSTLVVKVAANNPLFEPAYGIYSHRFGEYWLVGGASNSGGAVLAHFFSPERLNQLSAQIDADRPGGLDFYPLLRVGERFPFNDPELRPRMVPRPDDAVRFLQGLLEGIAGIEYRGYQLLSELGAPFPLRVLSIGGGAGNEVWRRLRENRLGVPVLRAPHSEAAYGAAVLGLRALGEAGTDGL